MSALLRNAPIVLETKEAQGSLITMKYWGYFIAKFAAAAVPLLGLRLLIDGIWPPLTNAYNYQLSRFAFDLPYTMAVLFWFLLCCGAVYLIVLDQRYRCRVCLRRLRMPVETGSWSRMLQFGRPRIEYICPYGHGTLREDEIQISGRQMPEWNPHSDDMWEELCAAASKDTGREP